MPFLDNKSASKRNEREYAFGKINPHKTFPKGRYQPVLFSFMMDRSMHGCVGEGKKINVWIYWVNDEWIIIKCL